MITAFIVFKEPITIMKLCGSGLILTGILLMIISIAFLMIAVSIGL